MRHIEQHSGNWVAGRFYRVVDGNNQIWAETSDLAEAKRQFKSALRPAKIVRYWTRSDIEWREVEND